MLHVSEKQRRDHVTGVMWDGEEKWGDKVRESGGREQICKDSLYSNP